jgi:hypothetical protein
MGKTAEDCIDRVEVGIPDGHKVWKVGLEAKMWEDICHLLACLPVRRHHRNFEEGVGSQQSCNLHDEHTCVSEQPHGETNC